MATDKDRGALFVVILVILFILAATLAVSDSCRQAQAQTGLVVQLSNDDAAKMKRLYDAREAAVEAYTDGVNEVGRKYVSDSRWEEETERLWITTDSSLVVGYNDPCSQIRGWLDGKVETPDIGKLLASCSEQKAKAKAAPKKKVLVYHLKDGWRSGFEFSQDFRFIVPKAPPMPSRYGEIYIPGAVNLNSQEK